MDLTRRASDGKRSMTAVEAVGYARVSTERQAGEVHTSMEDQEAAIRALAERLEVTVGRWFRDAGASGATVDGRPAFRDLLAWCEANTRPRTAPGHVFALNDSRFGRFPDPDEAAALRFGLKQAGWIVRFAEGDEVTGTLRSVVRSLGAAQASEYRENLVRNTRRGMKGAANQGFWTREAPFGYRRRVVYPPGAERVLELGQHKATNEKVKLTPHREEAAVVRWAFERYAGGGQSLGTLAEALKERVPGRRWGRRTVAALLQNDAYRGAVVGGRRREGPSETYGREDAHPAIVPAELWARAQARLERNATLGPGVRSHYLVSGILRCVHCGETYAGGGGGRSRTKDPTRSHRRFYRDSGGVAGVCPGRIGTVMRHLVDDRVLEVVSETIAKPRVRTRIERAIDDALATAGGIVGDSEASLRGARKGWEQRRRRLVAALGDGTLLPEEAAEPLEQIRTALSEIEQKLQALRFTRGRARRVHTERDRLLELAGSFGRVAERLSGPALREHVAPWLGSLTFDKVSRVMTLGIRPVPALASFPAYNWPGPDERQEVGLIVRRASLLQVGHEYRVDEAAEALGRERRTS
jgi:DNA invertase Pin-like site-specific DNA recombinase